MTLFKHEQELEIICADIKNYVESLEKTSEVFKIKKPKLSDFLSALDKVMQDSILVSEEDLKCINDFRMKCREIYRDIHPKPENLKELIQAFNEFNAHSEIQELRQSIEEANITTQP